MEEVAKELDDIVKGFIVRIEEIPDDLFSSKPLPDKWSKKEVLGHLIDSGQTNLRRFVCGQYDAIPTKIVYEQDFWVRANNYREMERKDTMELWRLINLQIANVLRTMPKENYTKECDSNKKEPQLKTLEWLASDYVKHLKHHLNQIIKGSFDITYP